MLAIIISYPTSASGIIASLKRPQNIDKSFQLGFVKTNGILQCTNTLRDQLFFSRTHGIVAHNP